MTLRTVEEQRAIALAAVRRHPPVMVDLADASGHALAVDAFAAGAVPPFDNSAMDGFAVHFADVATADAEHPVALRVVADVPAGSAADPRIAPGEAARIMTGAPVPTDADAIVPFESTAGGLADSLDTAVVELAPRALGAHIRRAGEDVALGGLVLRAGTLLGPRQLSALASAGIARVEVAPRPRVAVVSTGSELVPPGEPLARGQISESNGILIAGLVAEAGGDVVLRRVVDDEGSALTQTVAEAQRDGADAIVFTGGVSAGAYEVVRQTLGETMEFTRVAMQPGKPQGFGVTPDGMLLFALPGNPVGAAMSFEVFVRPALLHLQGRDVERPRRRMPAAVAWTSPAGRTQLLPAVIDRADPAGPRVAPATEGGSASHLVVGLGLAEAYVIVPPERTAVAAGDLVDVVEL